MSSPRAEKHPWVLQSSSRHLCDLRHWLVLDAHGDCCPGCQYQGNTFELVFLNVSWIFSCYCYFYRLQYITTRIYYGTMLNPIFWKNVQGQTHPGRWGIVEHQIPSIKVLFKTNTKSHKHLGIKLLSPESKTQLVNQRKQKVAFNPGIAQSPEIQPYRMWWGAASPILNDTPVVCIHTCYNRTHI